MAVLEILLRSPVASIAVITTALFFSLVIFRIILHPLSHIPGPLLPKITSLWLYYHSYFGDEATVIHELHKKYGPLVRVAPNEVDISDADAIAPIYVSRGGFAKPKCYANFDIDGHSTIFSTADPEHRSPRAKAVLPMFSTKNIKDNEAELYKCVDRMICRMQEEAKTGRPVNILNLTRSLALDSVSTHLFHENYNATSEKRLSASGFVDAFVAVGGVFYLPNTVFEWIGRASDIIWPNELVTKSMVMVDKFVDNMVARTSATAQTYAGRLLGIGLEISEVKSQCKDLMFAGTDSTGHNMATICQALSRDPVTYEKLRSEIIPNLAAGDGKVEAQGLPYLSGVIKEALRVSMANPTRLPRVVPSSGWTFKDTNFPPESLVGCSAFELHLNPTVFPDPKAFKPERWLEANVTPEMIKHSFGFGAGSRACIARNLALTELYMATEKVAESGVLLGARPCKDKIEIYEWFNSSVKDKKIELIWNTEKA